MTPAMMTARLVSHLCPFSALPAWPHAHRMRRRVGCNAILRLTDSEGTVTSIDEATASVGTSEDATLRISGPNAAPQHAELANARGKGWTCTALVGDAEDFTSESYTWLDGTPLRTGVQYLLSPGCSLAFGSPDSCYAVDFDAPNGDNPLLETLLKGMAAGASPEVQRRLGL